MALSSLTWGSTWLRAQLKWGFWALSLPWLKLEEYCSPAQLLGKKGSGKTGEDKEVCCSSGQQASGKHEELQQGAECCWLLWILRCGESWMSLSSRCRCVDWREISTNAKNRRESYFCALKAVCLAKLQGFYIEIIITNLLLMILFSVK